MLEFFEKSLKLRVVEAFELNLSISEKNEIRLRNGKLPSLNI
jgi:hypothetical protein